MSIPTYQEELDIAKKLYDKEVRIVSECCGAGINKGFCSDCKEGVVGEPEISFEDWLSENK